MATGNSTETVILRYVVLVDVRHGWRISSAFRGRDDALARAREERKLLERAWRAYNPNAWRVSVSRWQLRPNETIRAFGITQFDRMLVDISHNAITVQGSLGNLIDCGVISSHVRDMLGRSRCKSTADEFGNYYRLRPRGRDRFELRLYLCSSPLNPYGMRTVDPYETDISDILRRISRRR